MAGISAWERFNESLVPKNIVIFICDGNNVATATFKGMETDAKGRSTRQWEDYRLLTEKDLKAVKYWMSKERFTKVMIKARV